MSGVSGGYIFNMKRLFEERVEEHVQVQERHHRLNPQKDQDQKHLISPASMSQHNGAAASSQCKFPYQVPITVTLTQYVTDQLEAIDRPFVKLAQDTVNQINGQDGIPKTVYFIVKKEIGEFIRPSSSNSDDQVKPVFCVTINGADPCSSDDQNIVHFIRVQLTSEDWERTSTIVSQHYFA